MKAEYVDHMGNDLSVVNAARVSFDKVSEFEVWKEKLGLLPWQYVYREHLSVEDSSLIRYLAEHDHWTPFAHTAITLRMGAPVPIRTQAFKHKQGFVENEESRRYISSVPEIFIPDFFRSKPDGSIKQGSAGVHEGSDFWLSQYKGITRDAVMMYTEMVRDGVCPEQARFVLPQGAIVKWMWTGNLVSFANFYKKRTDPHAQKEIQILAKEVDKIIAPLYPASWRALTK